MGSLGLDRYQQVALTTPAVFLEQETSFIIQPHSQTPPQPGVESVNEANATSGFVSQILWIAGQRYIGN